MLKEAKGDGDDAAAVEAGEDAHPTYIFKKESELESDEVGEGKEVSEHNDDLDLELDPANLEPIPCSLCGKLMTEFYPCIMHHAELW